MMVRDIQYDCPRVLMQSDNKGIGGINVPTIEKNVAKYGYTGINRAIKKRRFL
jgi:hypothetical protein